MFVLEEFDFDLGLVFGSLWLPLGVFGFPLAVLWRPLRLLCNVLGHMWDPFGVPWAALGRLLDFVNKWTSFTEQMCPKYCA